MRSLILAGLLCGLVTPAIVDAPFPATICHSTERISDRLSQQQGAERTARGTQSPDQILEVWTNSSGAWTLVVTYATGVSCIVAMGDDWESLQALNPA